MPSSRNPTLGLAIALAVVALTALYLEPLRTGFLNDDYLFLEQARTQRLIDSVREIGPLGNYFRPLSRQVYFELLTPIGGGQPLVFHLANFALFLGALALLADLLLALVAPAGAVAGCLLFALFPFQRVNTTWISCSQDLMALAGALGALALHRRDRRLAALLCYAAAIASKESALPLPAAVLAWDLLIARRPARDAMRRVTPFAVCGLIWVAIAVGRRWSAPPLPLHFDLEHFTAGYVHLVQSLLGLDHPAGMLASLRSHAPAIVPLMAIAAAAFVLLPPRAAKPSGAAQRVPAAGGAADRAGDTRARERLAIGSVAREPAPPDTMAAARFAGVWLVAFGLVTGPVVATWSSYYYTLAAVGGAILVGLALRPIGAWSWIALAAGLLWWHAGSTGTRAFAIADRPWIWTSHLTSYYFERGAAATDTLSRQLRTLEPAPPRGTRFFFATLPSWAGFQMGNGALVRNLYRDSSLASHFYSQFSESTAAGYPCRFLYWNGAALESLYPGLENPYFQVGSDLLLLDRPAGAAHAFRRGIEAGGDRQDLLYWLGWAELWSGRRDAAEAAWSAFGARDDSTEWLLQLRQARTALFEDQDSLATRRHLLAAIEHGIGRPEAHAVLGQLLQASRPKYAMLELQVATRLHPGDWMARRDLFLGLTGVRLDDPARREFQALQTLYPEWRSDSAVTQAHRDLERRSMEGRTVADFR